MVLTFQLAKWFLSYWSNMQIIGLVNNSKTILPIKILLNTIS